jgi:hypothetical protein
MSGGPVRPACLPLAGAPVIAPPPGQPLRLPAAPGAAVHAVAPGVVVTVDPLVVRADDGRSYRYDGAVGARSPGARVTAGQPAATLRPGDGPGPASWLTVTVTTGDGDPVDAYDLLVGLPDPAEHGSWASDADPDLLATPAYRLPTTPARQAAAPPVSPVPAPPSGRLPAVSPTPQGPDLPPTRPAEPVDDDEDEDDPAAADQRAAALLLGRPRPSGPGAGEVE